MNMIQPVTINHDLIMSISHTEPLPVSSTRRVKRHSRKEMCQNRNITGHTQAHNLDALAQEMVTRTTLCLICRYPRDLIIIRIYDDSDYD